MTAGEMRLERREPGTLALVTTIPVTFAATASANGNSPPVCSSLHGRVAAATTSVFPVAPLNPGKCLATGTMPPAQPGGDVIGRPSWSSATAAEERVPSGLRSFGPSPPSMSSTGARSIAMPAARSRVATLFASNFICPGAIVAPMVLAEGITLARFATRSTSPPSSSTITKGGWRRARSGCAGRKCPRGAGGVDAPKRITPPASTVTSRFTAETFVSSTGTTTVCAASRWRFHVASAAACGAADRGRRRGCSTARGRRRAPRVRCWLRRPPSSSCRRIQRRRSPPRLRRSEVGLSEPRREHTMSQVDTTTPRACGDTDTNSRGFQKGPLHLGLRHRHPQSALDQEATPSPAARRCTSAAAA